MFCVPVCSWTKSDVSNVYETTAAADYRETARKIIRWCIKKFPDWPPGARTTNDIALSLDAVVALFCESV